MWNASLIYIMSFNCSSPKDNFVAWKLFDVFDEASVWGIIYFNENNRCESRSLLAVDDYNYVF